MGTHIYGEVSKRKQRFFLKDLSGRGGVLTLTRSELLKHYKGDEEIKDWVESCDEGDELRCSSEASKIIRIK